MKKVFLSLLAMTFAAISFTSCEDVPAPYYLGGVNGEDGPAPGTILSESFSGDFGSFTPIAVNENGFSWIIKSFSSGSWAVGTGYQNSENKASEAYLVSPEIDLSQVTAAYLQFEYVLAYANNAGEDSVFITSEYTDDPTTTVWEDITGTLDKHSDFNSSSIYKRAIPEQYIGKDKVRIAFYFTGTASGSKTWEIKNVLVREGAIEEDEPVILEKGTLENPMTVAEAHDFITAAEHLDMEVYVKGIISQVDEINLQYGNATYQISDDGTTENQLQIYRGYFFNGDKFLTGNEIKVSDEVIVVGKLVNYRGDTHQFTTGSKIYSLNGETESGDNPGPTPTPSGDNLLVNGDFESWTEGLPDNWKSTSTASNATLSQSTDAHGGSYAVLVKTGNTANKRMAYKELTLKAGTYTFKFYAKSTTANISQTEAGYCTVTNGVAGGYKYGEYTNLNNNGWTEVSTSFTLDAETTVCLLMMNPKNSNFATAQDILVDDAELITSDGGLVGGDDPNPQPSNTLSFDFKANGLSGWSIVDVNLPSALSYIWSYDTRYGMKASAFANQTNYDSESWLISPALDLSNLSPVVGHSLSISHAANYFANSVSDECQVLVSTDANAPTNPTAVNWIQLNVSAWPTSWTFVDATADLTSVIGQSTVFVAFKYTSTATKAGTWEISKASIE